MLKIAVIIGSTRPKRVGENVARWALDLLQKRDDADFELIDLRDFNLPLLDEPQSPAMGNYHHEHTKIWGRKVSEFDGYLFVTPEYNHAPCAALKNALDFVYKEWNNKVAGFVGYGSAGGTRAVEHLRLICAELQMATVRSQVSLNLITDFENMTIFRPQSFHSPKLHQVVDQIIKWGEAFKLMREGLETSDSKSLSLEDQPSMH